MFTTAVISLLLAFPLQGKIEAKDCSLSSSFWISGMDLKLRVQGANVPKDIPGAHFQDWMKKNVGVPMFRVGEKETQATKIGLSQDGGTLVVSLEQNLGSLPAGSVEVFLGKDNEKLGPWKLLILKAAAKADFDKATPEQPAKTAAVLLTTHGAMLLEFYPDKAPNTVRNFLKLSSKGFYDGSPFHRIIKDFMIQGGDPTGTGMGDAGYTLKAEFNDLEHRKGVISMARSPDPDFDSASCQFFIVHGAHASNLDRQYTAFGKLLDGLETLDKIASVPCEVGEGGEPSHPKEPVALKKVILVEKPTQGEKAVK